MDNDRMMKIITDDGKEIEMCVLFTTTLEEFNKNYVFYYDPKDENRNVYVASYDQNDTQGHLDAVEDDNEWAALDEVFKSFIEQANQGCNGNCKSCENDCANCENDCNNEEN